MTCVLFPGQGSQVRGMGGALFDAFPEMVRVADGILGYSVRELCLEDRRRELHQTRFSQPALFVVNALSYRDAVERTGLAPAFVCGHSLGEYSALFAAGAFDFATGLRLVQKRGELMGQMKDGAMAAVIGLPPPEVEAILRASDLRGVDLANYNAPDQVVISGPADEMARAAEIFEDRCRYVPLNTSGAFHSRVMAGAARAFADYLTRFQFAPLRIPVIANTKARPYRDEDIARNLAEQITNSVRWSESIDYVLSQRADIELVEIGPGKVLTKLAQAIRAARPVDDAVPAAPSVATSGASSSPDLVFMYGGSGSHYPGMGRELYVHEPVFRQSMDRCSDLLRADLDAPLVEVLYGDSAADLDRARYAQPALVAVGYSLTEVLATRGVRPTSVLGYSLGEYTAAVVSGALSLAEALRIVVAEARTLEEHGVSGGMAVVLEKTAFFEANPALFEGCTLAARNFDGCFVVSGPSTCISAVVDRLGDLSVVAQELPVGYAFHSRSLDGVEAPVLDALSRLELRPPTLPFHSCVAGPDQAAISPRHLWSAVRDTLDFAPVVRSLHAQRKDRLFVDLTPTGTLSTFVRHGFAGEIPAVTIIDAFGRNRETLASALHRLGGANSPAVSS